MPERIRYRCKKCGWSERIEVLNPRETEEAIRRQISVGPPHCPRCGSHLLERC